MENTIRNLVASIINASFNSGKGNRIFKIILRDIWFLFSATAGIRGMVYHNSHSEKHPFKGRGVSWEELHQKGAWRCKERKAHHVTRAMREGERWRVGFLQDHGPTDWWALLPWRAHCEATALPGAVCLMGLPVITSAGRCVIISKWQPPVGGGTTTMNSK